MRSRPRGPGFTLIELMLSLAMSLILILGINYVFRSATDAVGAGQALNGINSDAQSSQPVFFTDLQNVSKNPPAFIIASQLVTQFLNSDDAKNASDPNVMQIDNAGNYAFIGTNGTQPGYFPTASVPTEWISPALLNSRNHRADLLEFFAHGLYQRRTGPDGTFFASDSSQDAFIQIGHAALPANDLSNFFGPSNLPVGNTGYTNYSDLGTTYFQVPGVPRAGGYAADWVLARRAVLLKDPSDIPPYTLPPNTKTNGTDPYYTTGNGAPLQGPGNGTAFTVNLAPLSYGTPDTNGPPPVTQFQSSRYDLADVTPEEFDRIIANAILGWQNNVGGSYSGNSIWWNPLVYAYQLGQATGNATPPQYYQMTASATNLNGAIPPYIVPYTNVVPAYTGIPVPTTTDPGLWLNRPECNPLIQSPVSSASLAEMSPYFLQHCSQFIVEYAGDYMQQDVNGNMIGLGPDGQIDYYLDANGNKHIRWYGMPRSSTGALHMSGPPGATTPAPAQVLIRGYDSKGDTIVNGGTPAAASLNYFTDVIPLRDYYSLWFANNPPANPGTSSAYAPPWEVDVNFDGALDYGNPPTTTGGATGNYFGNPANPPRYVAAWHDDMPAMIRILIKVDDTNNKVKDGPWYEYVFRLK